jgi:hypothetical protein
MAKKKGQKNIYEVSAARNSVCMNISNKLQRKKEDMENALRK